MRKKIPVAKKHSKKLVSILLALIMVLCAIPIAAAANGTISVQTGREEVKPGESFDVTVSVDHVDALAGYLIYIYCDTDSFDAEIDSEDGTIKVQKGTFTSDGTMITNENGDEGWQTLWFSTDDVSGSGTLFTITLAAKEGAEAGDYEIKVGYSPENTIDVDANEQSFTTENTEITILGEVSPDDIPENDNDGNGSSSNTGSPGSGSGNGSNASDTLTTFSDVPRYHWAYSYIAELVEKGIVSGVGDGKFYPERNVTRAEFLKMLAGAVNAKTSGVVVNQFSDVRYTDWYYPYVSWAYSSGIVNGMSETSFAPNGLLTREQMATLIMRTLAWMGKEAPVKNEAISFTDENSISDYAKQAVSEVQRAGIIGGYPDGSFMPKGNLKRSEAAKVLAELMGVLQVEPTE